MNLNIYKRCSSKLLVVVLWDATLRFTPNLEDTLSLGMLVTACNTLWRHVTEYYGRHLQLECQLCVTIVPKLLFVITLS
jgi:hypothetical protein